MAKKGKRTHHCIVRIKVSPELSVGLRDCVKTWRKALKYQRRIVKLLRRNGLLLARLARRPGAIFTSQSF